jgi:hypothetical protein
MAIGSKHIVSFISVRRPADLSAFKPAIGRQQMQAFTGRMPPAFFVVTSINEVEIFSLALNLISTDLLTRIEGLK